MSDDHDLHAEVEAALDFLYGEEESPEKTERRDAIFVEKDGKTTISGFQITALRMAVQAKRAEDAAEQPAQPALEPLPQVTPELADDIPEPVEGYDRPDLVGLIKANVDIVGAVQRWGKLQPNLKVGSRTESIMIRCPRPDHVDNNPSAWINTSKNLWHCGACNEGGDQIAFYAAAKRGLTQQELRNKDMFPQILQEMAEELGIDPDPPVAAPPPPEPAPDQDPDEVMLMPEPDVPPAPDNEAPTTSVEPDLAAIDPQPRVDPRDVVDPLNVTGIPTYDWRDLDIPRDTFLHDWLEHTTRNHPAVAPEFFILLGFQAIGLACGHHLQQRTPHKGLTNAALMLVLVGPSGSGKTTARDCLVDLLKDGRGSKFDNDTGEGVSVFATPGSPEALCDEFAFQIRSTLDWAPITGLMSEGEFVTLVSKSRRKGGEHLKPTIQDFFDFVKKSPDPEVVARSRTRGAGINVVYDAYFSMVSTTQTDTVRNHIDDTDMVSGFMNRILPVFGKPLFDDDPTFIKDKKRPPYVNSWDYLWEQVRGRPIRTEIEWAPDVGLHLKRHQSWGELGVYERMDETSILSRLKHTACKLAFLLAINEGISTYSPPTLPQIECRHFDTVLRFIKGFLQPCYGYFENAAKSTDTKDVKNRLLEFLHDFMEKNGRWPDRRALAMQRFWRMAPEHTQMISMNNLIDNHLVAEIILVQGKSRVKVLIATDRDDHWGNSYKGQHGQPFIKDTFYAKS